LKAKARALRFGKDDTDYIQKALDIKNKKEKLHNYLNDKYNYKDKKIVSENKEVEDDKNIIK